ncbi:hypothetical protein [Kitasatospora sp. NPDC089509]|uniref:hypothetical protein n=1 Tax=Kitasatospora sp. NPDC089509 TaxID=3364079 RepID=UPI00381844D8
MGLAVGGRLAGAAVAGVLVFGGGVAAAGPAVAVPVVRMAGQVGPAVERTAPARQQVRAGLRAHLITGHSAARHRHKVRRSVVGRALDAVFGWFALVVLVVLSVVVLVVCAVRRWGGR